MTTIFKGTVVTLTATLAQYCNSYGRDDAQ